MVGLVIAIQEQMSKTFEDTDSNTNIRNVWIALVKKLLI